MGNDSSKSFWGPKKETFNVAIGGLDAAGKTTLLYRLGATPERTIPSLGYTIESCHLRGLSIKAWDTSGRSRILSFDKLLIFNDSQALIWMVDSNDKDRFAESLGELKLKMDIFAEIKPDFPLLLLCNKQDLPGAESVEKVVERFNEVTEHRPFLALGCSACKNENIQEGLDWVYETLSEPKAAVPKNPPKEQAPADSSNSAELDFVTTFEGGNRTLMNFSPIKNGTECPFAKAAVLWGGKAFYDEAVSLENQAAANVGALTAFCRRLHADEKDKLDGFCLELQDQLATCGSPQDLGRCVRRVLTVLSDLDPAREGCMRVSYIGTQSWRFRFDRIDFFITTFAPCYPKTNSRYSFETGRAFVLFQPYLSFNRHDLPPDTPDTDWDAPKNIRDKARIAFREAGRFYHIPSTLSYPQAEHIVKPLQDDGSSVITWWQ